MKILTRCPTDTIVIRSIDLNQILEYLDSKKIPYIIKKDFTLPNNPITIMPIEIFKEGRFYKASNANSRNGSTIIRAFIARAMFEYGICKKRKEKK